MAESEKVGLTGNVPSVAPSVPLPCLHLPSFTDACERVAGEYSCLVVETHRRHLALSPKFLKRKRSGIQEQLNAELLKYSEGLKGVPVAYDNIKLVGELGDIYDDLGHVYVNIEADFVIFKPKFGQKLVGVVNKVAQTHIGCLVHGCFNASIPKPPKMPIENWQQIGVNVDDQIEFEVFRLDSDAVGVFCIRGKLNKSMEAKAYETATQDNAEQAVNITDRENVIENLQAEPDIETNGIIQERSKKKSKKQKFQDVQEVEHTEEYFSIEHANVDITEELQEETPRKKGKRTKQKDFLMQNRESDAEKGTDSADVNENIFCESPVILKSKKFKKKESNGMNLQDFHSTFLNGTEEKSSLLESMLDDVTVDGNASHKKKKKHKRSCLDLDSDNNLANFVVPGGSVIESLTSEEMTKRKKHKTKHQEHLLTENNLNRKNKKTKMAPEKEQEFSVIAAEPEAKKRRR
ncbi:hypothetical protein GDO86_011749 [Hymenochirus boettgeri]|uniref:DNA-directed RNA polymerase subunit n=1 Tax=Hymenochirus boettgeri TaxID=247094 RepID=A0A8T2JCR0_9PIPI|nr:hypothetical protein GDO86_011749 [Hymenochirus boettgeri]